MQPEGRRVRRVAIYSIKGGTGRSAVTANLGAELTRRGVRCLLADMDPQNTLGLHFGMEIGERFGIAQTGMTPPDLEAYRRRNPNDVWHLPFGRLSPGEVLDVQDERQQEPGWLTTRLARYVPKGTEIVLLDMPPGYDRWAVEELRAVDLVLVVLLADGASYATTPTIEELLEGRSKATIHFLINQLDSRHTLSRDVRDSLHNLLGERLLPFVIPYDESVREALAQQRVLLQHAPESRTVTEFEKLADWLQTRLADLDDDGGNGRGDG